MLDNARRYLHMMSLKEDVGNCSLDEDSYKPFLIFLQ